MERSAWTDERLDDLAATLDTNVRMLREEIHGLRADISSWQRQIAQIGWSLVVALIGAIVALIIAVQ
jgi:hypothetical protein